MTGARHGRILRGRKKEHAVGTEYFPWRPRSLPTASEFPSHSWESESTVHEQGEPIRRRPRIALPPRPAPEVPSRGGFLGSRGRAAPKVTERPSLHLKCSRTDNLERRVHIHGAVTNSHYFRALCVCLGLEKTLQKPATVRGAWWGCVAEALPGGKFFSHPWARGGNRGALLNQLPLPQPDLPLSTHP